MSTEGSSSATRLLVYSHDGFGLGNLSRTLKMCDSLSQQIQPLSILLVTSSPMVHGFRLPANVDYVKLPCVHRHKRNRYVSKYLSMPVEDLSKFRADLIHSSFQRFKPHLVVIDKAPLGINGELCKSIRWLKRERPQAKLILGLRDVLDNPEHVRALWSSEKFYDAVERYYDSIWVFGSPQVYDVVKEYGFSEAMAAKLSYCGYLLHNPEPRPAADVRRELGVGQGKLVLVTAGGGGDGYDLMKTYLKSIRDLSGAENGKGKGNGNGNGHGNGNGNGAPPVHSLLVLGPEMKPLRKQRLMAKAAVTPGVTRVLEFSTEISSYMNAADLVVSMGGYNTTCEILALQKRAIVVPRVHPVQEQWIRAQRLQDLGLIEMLDPRNLNSEALGAKITAALTDTPARGRVCPVVLSVQGLPPISSLFPAPQAPVDGNGKMAERTVA